MVINAPVEIVFSNVNRMTNWQKWGGPWHEEGMDFNEVIQRIEGADFGIGSKLIYDQGKGEGSVKVVESEINKFLEEPGGWLILNLHGLDNEGWGPVSTNYLDGLLKRLVDIEPAVDRLTFASPGHAARSS